MPLTIDESDWNLLRRLHKVALERFSKRILDEIEELRTNSSKDYHQRYLEVYDLIERRNEDMAMAFDDLRRSRAFDHIAALCALGLLTKEEFSGFTEPSQERMKSFLGSWHA